MSLGDRSRPVVIAHRGASAAHRENTLAAFAGARDLGADWVELDARRTADRHVVVHHDSELVDGRLIVALSAAELPSHIPNLAEALEECQPMGVNIEIKNWPDDPDFDETDLVADAVVALTSDRDKWNDLLVSCFHLPTIDHVHRSDPSLATAFLYATIDGPTGLALAIEHGHRLVHPWDPYVTAELIEEAHRAGVAVNTWTVDDPDRMEQLVEWGVDGIVTNVPDVARSIVDGP